MGSLKMIKSYLILTLLPSLILAAPTNGTNATVLPQNNQVVQDSVVVQVIQIINRDNQNDEGETTIEPTSWTNTTTSNMTMASTASTVSPMSNAPGTPWSQPVTISFPISVNSTINNLSGNGTTNPLCDTCSTQVMEPCKCDGVCYLNNCFAQHSYCGDGVIGSNICKQYLKVCPLLGC